MTGTRFPLGHLVEGAIPTEANRHNYWGSSMRDINESTATALTRLGECVYFVACVGGVGACEALNAHGDRAVGVWWNALSGRDQMYFVQYLRPIPKMNYIVYPSWQMMALEARKGLGKNLRDAIERALKTMSEAAPREMAG